MITKSWFFEKIKNIDKPLARLIKKKRVKIKSTELGMRKEWSQHTMQKYKKSKETNMSNCTLRKQTTQRKCSAFQKSSTSFNLRLNQEEIEIMNKTIRNTEVKTVIKNLPQEKSPRPDGFTGEFHKTLRQELTPILPKSS